MIEINNKLLKKLITKAADSERRRMNYDLRTHSTGSGQACEDGGQRMLNVLLLGTCVPIHRHPMSNENVLFLRGRLDELLYDVRPTDSTDSGVSSGTELVETERVHLDPSEGSYGCFIPTGAWHTMEVIEPTVIFEAKGDKYGPSHPTM